MKALQVQKDIAQALEFLAEHSPTDELRDVVITLHNDLRSTNQLFVVEKYQRRGREMSRLAYKASQLDKENKMLSRRLEAIGRLSTGL